MDNYIGEVRMFAGNFSPVGWAFCNGQLLPISGNEALYTLVGTTYGGDGQNTFGLPDLRGRTPVHYGTGPGLPPVVQGQIAGTEEITLITAQMPSHTHTINAQTSAGNSPAPGNNIFADTGVNDNEYTPFVNGAGTNVTMGASSVLSAGGNQPYSICQPSVCVTFIIALNGIFPTQN